MRAALPHASAYRGEKKKRGAPVELGWGGKEVGFSDPIPRGLLGLIRYWVRARGFFLLQVNKLRLGCITPPGHGPAASWAARDGGTTAYLDGKNSVQATTQQQPTTNQIVPMGCVYITEVKPRREITECGRRKERRGQSWE